MNGKKSLKNKVITPNEIKAGPEYKYDAQHDYHCKCDNACKCSREYRKKLETDLFQMIFSRSHQFRLIFSDTAPSELNPLLRWCVAAPPEWSLSKLLKSFKKTYTLKIREKYKKLDFIELKIEIKNLSRRQLIVLPLRLSILFYKKWISFATLENILRKIQKERIERERRRFKPVQEQKEESMREIVASINNYDLMYCMVNLLLHCRLLSPCRLPSSFAERQKELLSNTTLENGFWLLSVITESQSHVLKSHELLKAVASWINHIVPIHLKKVHRNFKEQALCLSEQTLFDNIIEKNQFSAVGLKQYNKVQRGYFADKGALFDLCPSRFFPNLPTITFFSALRGVSVNSIKKSIALTANLTIFLQGFCCVFMQQFSMRDFLDKQRAGRARLERARLERARVEQARVERARLERARVEQARVEEARVEQARVEEARVEQARLEQQAQEECKDNDLLPQIG